MTTDEKAQQFQYDDIVKLIVANDALQQRCASLQQQLDWYKKQLFGPKSEKRYLDGERLQLPLDLGVTATEEPPVAPKQTIAYERAVRRPKQRGEDVLNEEGLRFGADVPVKEIVVNPPEIAGLSPDQYTVIREEKTHRLAQRPGSAVVLCYITPVVKLKETQALVQASAPANVLERCSADVSVLAGLLIDKFVYHLPLYRQHQRLRDQGIELSRATLDNWVKRAIALLNPIYDAQLLSVHQSTILAMDETPIKATPKKDGKRGMKTGYYWPVYGDKDEVVFPFAMSRGTQSLHAILGDYQGTLLSDGYAAYDRYTHRVESVVHANCWVHWRRTFLEAENTEPERVKHVLETIGALYRHEERQRTQNLNTEAILAYRATHEKPLVDQLFEWLENQLNANDLLPTDAFTKAVKYGLSRRAELSVFLSDPNVAMDTNHVERALRVIPMGKKNWLFCWTEAGAKDVGVIQSLLATCKLHGIDYYTYLVDVLQRVGQHPQSKVHELTPRIWKTLFADDPLRSDVHEQRVVVTKDARGSAITG
ncbi:MAG: IS66 family transposase [Gammaproteobacteria bacterium]|nr:IS66 family transposase [Gammaproteobacteria bacterium]